MKISSYLLILLTSLIAINCKDICKVHDKDGNIITVGMDECIYDRTATNEALECCFFKGKYKKDRVTY